MITLHFHLQPQYKYELFHINFTFIKLSQSETVSGNQNHIHQLCNKQLQWLTDELGIWPTAPHAPRMSKEQHWDEARKVTCAHACLSSYDMLAFSSFVRIDLYHTAVILSPRRIKSFVFARLASHWMRG